MEEKKTLLQKISPGDIIKLVGVGIMIAIGYSNMNDHIKDDALHINKGEVVLTEEQKTNLVKFANTVEAYLKVIDDNTTSLGEIKTRNAVHKTEYEFLLVEHEDLESKVSRINKELNDRINKLED